jgi:hypothetical protein
MTTVRSQRRPDLWALINRPALRRALAVAVLGTTAAGVLGVLPGAAAQAATASTTAPLTVWPASTVPAVVDGLDSNAVEVGMKFKADVNGSITGVRFYKSTANTGTHTGKLWSSGGRLLRSATFVNETASGWQQVTFSSPVAVTAGKVYVASYYAPRGRYSATEKYFAGKGADNGPLHALASGVSGANGVYRYGSSGFPTSSYNATNYWVDVVFTSAAVTTTTVAPTTSTTVRPTTTTTTPPPAPAAWPGPTNTGVPAGTVLTTVNGGMVVNTPGTIVSDKDIVGCVTINASNVTLKRVRVRGCSAEPVVNVGYGKTGILVEDSEIDGGNTNSLGSGIGYEGYTLRRSNVHRVSKGAHMTNNVVVEDNWIHDLYEGPDSHNDNVVSNGGSNFVVRHNTFQNNHTQTATVALYGDFAPISNVLVENNLLVGGGFTVYGGSVAGKPYSAGANNIRFVNNTFSRQYWPKGGYWGHVSAFDPSKPGNAWSGNVWAETGQPVTVG